MTVTVPQPNSIVDRLIQAADRPTGVRFVGNSVAPETGDAFVPWAQIHDEARVVGAALQARGLVPGDQWCLCAMRWKEAYDAGCAPKVALESTHILTLEFVNLAALKEHALD